MTSTQQRLAAAIGLLASFGFAATSDPGFSPRGKQLFSDDFDGSALAAGWNGKPGTWEVSGGAVKASEKPEDKHAAVRRHPLAYHDGIFEFAFRLDGARAIHLSLNNKNGHVCRVIITPKSVTLQTDVPNHDSTLKPERLGMLNTTLAPGQWHKAIVEVRGRRMTAQIDGGEPVTGESSRVDVDKNDFGFPVSGVSASIDYVRVYEVGAR
jgi:hypothetical protein